MRQAENQSGKRPDGFFDALRREGYTPAGHSTILKTVFTDHANQSNISPNRRDGHVKSLMTRYATFYRKNISKR